MLRKSILTVLLLVALSVSSVFAAEGDTTTLRIDLNGLSNLGNTAEYEGWLIVDGAPVSTGTFDVDGAESTQDFTVSADDAAAAAAFVLTIEPQVDPDPAPAATHAVAGDFTNGRANLTVGHPAALGDDFATAGGGYILAAPSGDNAPYNYGFWFLQNGEASLDVPVLPEGWAYEGWVVTENGPISTGTFTDAAAADSDAGGPTAGPNGTPPVPGQDFVNPPLNLLDKTIVISIEPVPDNSPAPFDYKPLIDINVDDVRVAGGFQRLQQNLGSLATGAAYFVDAPVAEAPAQEAPAAPAPVISNSNVVIFNTPAGAAAAGPAFPGDAYEFAFSASRGQSLHFATMLVQSNDYFFAPNEWGIPLFDSNGNAISGNVTDYVHLWDSGTEANERPGTGANQAPRQAAANTGDVDSDRRVRRTHDNFGVIPAVNQLINVTLTHTGDDNFVLRIENVSGGAFGSPIAPGVAIVTGDYAPIFQNQFVDRNLGLEELAEDGSPVRLAENLR